jgi:ADP-heptose:LPS heptosyltransferase
MIIISPYAKGMRNGEPHPKNYPFWKELLPQITDEVIQIGIEGEEQLVPKFLKNQTLTQLGELVRQCRTWISVDSFFQHFCWDLGKRGIVLFGQSDPLIFGHPENVNLLKDRKNLREKQFWMWEQTTFNPNHFVKPDVVLKALKEFK